MTARLFKDQRNQVIGVLKARSTVNDIAHHFGCYRQTIHYLMNRYNRTGYVRVRTDVASDVGVHFKNVGVLSIENSLFHLFHYTFLQTKHQRKGY